MGYKEEILENGNILRTYFALDDSKFYEIYHNGKKIYFPLKEMQLGTGQRINLMIDFRKFELNFSLVNIRLLWEQKLCAQYPCASEVYLRMSPQTTGTDGFFVCVLERMS